MRRRVTCSTIDILIDNMWRGTPVYNQFRPDIAALFPGYANRNGAVGSFILDTTKYANGVHAIAWVVRDNMGKPESAAAISPSRIRELLRMHDCGPSKAFLWRCTGG